ncbi:MAG: hypothetical protein HY332_14225 [Chloroflexi bacterium]|nr:hypothetical protein [Chloroflexota bacterium]
MVGRNSQSAPAGNDGVASLGTSVPTTITVSGPWTALDVAGREVSAPALGDWVQVPAWKRFSDTIVYRVTVTLPERTARVEIDLGDLGDVGEAAVVVVNGALVGAALWVPYRLQSTGSVWVEGADLLEVRVTNSAANYFDGALRPSGLIGPVRLLVWPARGA